MIVALLVVLAAATLGSRPGAKRGWSWVRSGNRPPQYVERNATSDRGAAGRAIQRHQHDALADRVGRLSR